MVGTLLNRRLARAALALALGTGLAACDNPVEEEHEEEHAIGLIVFNSANQEVARINIEAATAVTGQIRVAPSGSQTFRVVALAEDGDQIPISGEFGLTATSAATNLATVGIQGADQLVVTGRAAGSTTLRLALLHEGHEDFGRDIPLIVQ